MRTMNRVTLIGRLLLDPERIGDFTRLVLGTKRAHRTPDGTWGEEEDKHEIRVGHGASGAVQASAVARKGDLLTIEGDIRYSTGTGGVVLATIHADRISILQQSADATSRGEVTDG